MADTSQIMQRLIDRAAADPNFAQQLAVDPLGAAEAAGFQISPAELAAFMGMAGQSNDVVVEELRSRIAYVDPTERTGIR